MRVHRRVFNGLQHAIATIPPCSRSPAHPSYKAFCLPRAAAGRAHAQDPGCGAPQLQKARRSRSWAPPPQAVNVLMSPLHGVQCMLGTQPRHGVTGAGRGHWKGACAALALVVGLAPGAELLLGLPVGVVLLLELLLQRLIRVPRRGDDGPARSSTPETSDRLPDPEKRMPSEQQQAAPHACTSLGA